MNRSFIKMHGLGNDFVIIDNRDSGALPDERSRRLIADRHRGVGCDQLIVLLPPRHPEATLFMGIYNPDGSEAGACGNATRCVGRLLCEETGQERVVIQTVSGLLPTTITKDGVIAVDFGPPRLDWQQIPLAIATDTLHVPLNRDDIPNPCCVSVGNPHAVFFVPDVAAINLSAVGPALETNAMFPDRANIEFAQILNRDHIRMRVWERGAGITQACGSAACATLVAAVRRGLADRQAIITLDGGDLGVAWREDGHVILSGPAALAFHGVFSEELWASVGAE